MKSHDILLLLKLISLDRSSAPSNHYTVRALGAYLGLAKSTIATSLKRCHRLDFLTDNQVNRSNLLEFIIYALRYVFPAKRGTLARGVATGIHTLAGSHLLSAGDLIYVWPYARGHYTGLSIEPLYKTVPHAALTDRLLYELLICVDSIRMGNARERNLATAHLKKAFELLSK